MKDLKVCGLSETGTQDRVSWRSPVKNSRQEPIPSNGSAPQSMLRLWQGAFWGWWKIWKYVVYLRPALRIECRGDHLWRTVDRSLPRLTEALLRAWLRLRHGVFWRYVPAPLTKLDLIDWLIQNYFFKILFKFPRGQLVKGTNLVRRPHSHAPRSVEYWS